MSRDTGRDPDDLLEAGAGDPRRTGAHRARPGLLRRLAPVLLVLLLAVLAVVAVSVWFSAPG